MIIHSEGIPFKEQQMEKQNDVILAHQAQIFKEWHLLYTTMTLLSLRLDDRYAGDATAETVVDELKCIYNNFRKEWDQCQKKK